MFFMVYKLITFFVVVFGSIICSRKKIILHSAIVVLPLVYILVFGFIYAENQKGNIFMSIVIIAVLIIFGLVFLKGKYEVYNISKDELIRLINRVLSENNIEYENEESAINLTEFKLKIILNEVLNVTYIDMHKIINTKYYLNIKNQIKESLDMTRKKYFSFMGILYIIYAMLFFTLRIKGMR